MQAHTPSEHDCDLFARDADCYSYVACAECCLNHILCECEHDDE